MCGRLVIIFPVYVCIVSAGRRAVPHPVCVWERERERERERGWSERDRRAREREGSDMEKMRRGSRKHRIKRKWVTQKWGWERICG